ncbi:hypothetical protein QTP88_005391 [Uroleucon formosanum]
MQFNDCARLADPAPSIQTVTRIMHFYRPACGCRFARIYFLCSVSDRIELSMSPAILSLSSRPTWNYNNSKMRSSGLAYTAIEQRRSTVIWRRLMFYRDYLDKLRPNSQQLLIGSLRNVDCSPRNA